MRGNEVILRRRRDTRKLCPYPLAREETGAYEPDYLSLCIDNTRATPDEIVDLRERFRRMSNDVFLQRLAEALSARSGKREGIAAVLGWSDYATRVHLRRLEELFRPYLRRRAREASRHGAR